MTYPDIFFAGANLGICKYHAELDAEKEKLTTRKSGIVTKMIFSTIVQTFRIWRKQ